MSDAIPTSVTYSSYEEFAANTRVPAQVEIDETTVWKPAALHAEYIIDSYVNCVKKYDVEQYRLFPTVDRYGDSSVPADVRKAHIELTSWLLLKGAPSASDEEVSGKKVGGESWQSTGYSKNYARGDRESADKVNMNLPPLVLRLLAPWHTKTAAVRY